MCNGRGVPAWDTIMGRRSAEAIDSKWFKYPVRLAYAVSLIWKQDMSYENIFSSIDIRMAGTDFGVI
jgi:dihydrofolate reductase